MGRYKEIYKHIKNINPLFFLLTFAVIQLTIYALVIPFGQGLDEGAHYGYIITLAETNFMAFTNVALHDYAIDPPLYYMAGAVLFKILHMFIDARYILLILRFISVMLAIGAIIFAIKSINCLITNKVVKNIAYAVIVFHPTLSLNASRISNDVAEIFFSSMLIYFMIKYFFLKKMPVKNYFILGFLLSAGVLSKQPMLGFIPVLFLYSVIRAVYYKQFKKEAVMLLCVMLIFLLVSGWYFSLSYAKFGKITTRAKKLNLFENKEISWASYFSKMPMMPGMVLKYSKNLFVNHFAVLGGAQVYMSKFYYFSFFIFTCLAFIGLALFFNSAYKTGLNKKHLLVLIMLFIVLVGVTGFLYQNISYFMRELPPRFTRSGHFNFLIAAESVLFAVGLTELFKNIPRVRSVFLFIFVLFLIFTNLMVLFYYYVPVYLLWGAP